jgi:hypothetical protein
MTFGEAIEALKVGDRVSRVGWSFGKGSGGEKMWLRLQKPDESSDMTLPFYVNRERRPCPVARIANRHAGRGLVRPRVCYRAYERRWGILRP